MTRRPRIWRVRDVAAHVFGESSPAACVRARRMLLRLQSMNPRVRFLEGNGRAYRVVVAALRKAAPDLFAPLDVEGRLAAVEEAVAELRVDQRRIVAQVGANTRAIERVRTR